MVTLIFFHPDLSPISIICNANLKRNILMLNMRENGRAQFRGLDGSRRGFQVDFLPREMRRAFYWFEGRQNFANYAFHWFEGRQAKFFQKYTVLQRVMYQWSENGFTKGNASIEKVHLQGMMLSSKSIQVYNKCKGFIFTMKHFLQGLPQTLIDKAAHPFVSKDGCEERRDRERGDLFSVS